MKCFHLTNLDKLHIIEIQEPGNYEVFLSKPGVKAVVIGKFVSSESKKTIGVKIVHQAKNTQSHTYLRGVAQDNSQLHISGTIIVEPTAALTNAFLDERVLLLTPNARAEAIPNLEIANNDVKCSHAATISSISSEQLFYLMSRGIDQETAIKLIVDGFLQTNPNWLK